MMNKSRHMHWQTAGKGGKLEVPVECLPNIYDVYEELGRGRFSVVKKCTHKASGITCAAKFLRKRRKGKDCEQELLHEVAMLELHHPNLVNLVQVFHTAQELIIVTEYAAGGELFQHIMEDDGLSEPQSVHILCQLLAGLQFLHDRDIVHLDIKPQNILLTAAPPHGIVKLCDFGFARTVDSEEEVRDIIGTPDYVAPEVLSYEPLCTACDMWSVGVLSYVMLTGCSPFTGSTKMETFCNITQIKYDFPEEMFEGISQRALDFIESLLIKDPEERMSVHTSLQHPWLKEEAISPDNKDSTLVSSTAALHNTDSVLTPSTVISGTSPITHTSSDKPSPLVSHSPSAADMKYPVISNSLPDTGSPVGCRRALPASECTSEAIPLKKCRCELEQLPNLCEQCEEFPYPAPVSGMGTSTHVSRIADQQLIQDTTTSSIAATVGSSSSFIIDQQHANGNLVRCRVCNDIVISNLQNSEDEENMSNKSKSQDHSNKSSQSNGVVISSHTHYANVSNVSHEQCESVKISLSLTDTEPDNFHAFQKEVT